MDVAADAQTLAAALNHSAFNVANRPEPGSAARRSRQGFGWTFTGWVAAVLALGGFAVFGLSCLLERRTGAVGPSAVPI